MDVGGRADRLLEIHRIQVSFIALFLDRSGTETDQECIGDSTEVNQRGDPTSFGTPESSIHSGELDGRLLKQDLRGRTGEESFSEVASQEGCSLKKH